jgi:hypothetical protein
VKASEPHVVPVYDAPVRGIAVAAGLSLAGWAALAALVWQVMQVVLPTGA